MTRLRIRTLQGALGSFYLLIGTLILVMPHQFATAGLLQQRVITYSWGTLFLLVGLAFGGVVLLDPGRRAAIAVHTVGGATLLLLAAQFIPIGAWVGGINFAILGVGTLLAPFVGGLERRRSLPTGDLFGCLIGLGLLLGGGLMLAAPGLFGSPTFAPAPGSSPAYGAVFLAAGLGLTVVHWRPMLPRPVVWAIHLLAAAAMAAYVLPFLPQRAWVQIAYFGGFGALVALLPWLDVRERLLDPRALATRTAAVLAGVTTLALVMVVSFTSEQEEWMMTQQVQLHQRNLAHALAQDVANYVRLHRESVIAMATQPDMGELDAERHREVAASFAAAHADAFVYSTFDATGAPIVRSDGRPLVAARPDGVVVEVLRTGRPAIEIVTSPTLEGLVFAFGAPIRDRQGRLVGAVSSGVEAVYLGRLLSQLAATADIELYLIDGSGRVIAHPTPWLPLPLNGRAASPPVAAFLNGSSTAVQLRYSDARGGMLAAVAPVGDLGWGVVVERTEAVALASVHGGRDLAFAALVLLAAWACGTGALAAGRLTRPLRMLAAALRDLPAVNPAAPLPAVRVTELAEIGAAITGLREQLAARTRERDEAEARLRFLAEAGVALHDTLDYGAALQHAARLAVPTLATWCVIDLLDDDGRLERVAVAHADPGRAQLAQELCRYPPDANSDGGIARVIRTGQPAISPPGADLLRDAGTRDAGDHELLRQLGSGAYMTIPLPDRDRVLGAMTFVRSDPARHYGPDDLTLAEELARRVGLAIENARLYRSTREARERAEVDRRHLQTLIDQLPEAVVLCDRAGRFLVVNRMARALAREEPGRLDPFGNTLLFDLRLPTERPAPPEETPLARAIRHGEATSNAEFLLVRPDGQMLPVWATAVPIYNERDEPVGAVAVFEDISAVKELERLRDEWVAVIAHDLRQPVTVITGYANLLATLAKRQGGSPQQARSAEHIVASARRLNRMIEDLLDTARLEAGRLALQRRPVDLAGLAREVIERMADVTRGHPVHLRVEGECHVADADPERIEQVLGNLLSNAAKYGDAASPIQVEVADHGSEVVVAVTNRGPGIPPDQLGRLFHRFYRTPQAEAGPVERLGLGLSICQQLIRAHGGRIEAESTPGEMTTFRVYLPAAAAGRDSSGGAERVADGVPAPEGDDAAPPAGEG